VDGNLRASSYRSFGQCSQQPMCVVFHDPVDQSVMRVGRLG
jgi:hypothetical protein